MVEHILGWAAEQGYEARTDPARNVVISVPPTSGRETAPALVLQGHLDMVCERQPDSPNDPAAGRIVLRRDGDWLTADGTTLGADNGVAIAAMLALVEDESLPHGSLELLMTVAEEVGLEGASALDGAMLSGRLLLNLDSGEDGRLTVGCAGSTDTWIRLTAPRGPVDGEARDARGHGERRARGPLRRGYRPRPLQRDQGARPGAAGDARRCALPPRRARRWEKPECDSARRGRGLLGGGGQ